MAVEGVGGTKATVTEADIGEELLNLEGDIIQQEEPDFEDVFDKELDAILAGLYAEFEVEAQGVY